MVRYACRLQDEFRPAPGGAPAPAARVIDARKVYGRGPSAVTALDGVTAEFLEGRFTAVMGPSPGAPRGAISASVLAALRDAPGVASAEGQITGFGEMTGSNGKPVTGLGPRSAGNWLTDPLLNPWHLVSGAPPRGPGEVVIDRGSAMKGRLRIGQQTTIFTPQPVPETWALVMAKPGARDRVQLVVVAYESGLVRPGWVAG